MKAKLHRVRESIADFVTSSESSLFDVLGGWRGLVDAIGPNLLFLAAYLATADLVVAIGAALAMSMLLAVIRLATGQRIREAIGGVFLVVASGLLVALTGNGSDFFLPELIRTGVVSALLLLSLAARRPVVGLLLGPVVSGRRWRDDRTMLRAYDWCTAIWAAVALVRTGSKLPFYLSGDLLALGIVDIVTGVPLLLAAVWLQLRVLRAAYRPRTACLTLRQL
jgi:hypothetical protein